MSGRIRHTFFNPAAEMLAIAAIGAALLGPALAAEGSSPSLPAAPVEVDAAAALGSQEELSKLLPLLLTSEERKKLAMELEASVRQGNLKGAEDRLNTAIEMGTLAIVLVDRLHDPKLLASLQALGIRGEDQQAPSPQTAGNTTAANVCTADAAADAARLRELQEALEREKAQSSAVSQELATLTQEYRALTSRQESQESQATAAASKASELEAALQQERERNEAATRQLASLQDEHRALQDQQARNVEKTKSMVAELQAQVQQERDRGADAARQLASAQEELRAVKSAREQDAASESTRIAELKDALAREKVKSEAITRELADAIETIEQLRAAQEAQKQSNAKAEPVSPATASAAPAAEPAKQLASALPLPELGLTAVSPPAAEKTRPPVIDPVQTASLPETGPAKAEPPQAPPKPEDRLMIRADELFRKGDVSGARLLLERSMEAGNAQAAFRLAETFDPQVLARMGALGIRGDAAKARELYARARSLGVAQAGERMEALK